MRDLRNSMVSLGKTDLDVKLIRKILRSLPERFRIKVTTIEESKELEEMKIEELVGSLQTYELSLPPVKKVKTIALKASKTKAKVSFEEDSEKEEDDVAMLAMNFGRLMRNDRFKRNSLKDWRRLPESLNLRKLKRKTPEAQDVLNAQALGIYRLIVTCENLKQGKGKAYNATLSDGSEEEESLDLDNFLTFVAPHV
jgi:ribosomal protein L12E/L44/L45/RPP1/RPP2